MTHVPPIRRHIDVATGVETAFALFTAHIGAWWPLAGHSVDGDGGLVAFEGGLLVERSAAGAHVWGEVLEWTPPTSLRLTWHPGRPADDATDVTVTFSPDGDRTRVTVVHAGWEQSDEAAERAANYGEGWPLVLERFSNRVFAFAGDAEPGASSVNDTNDTNDAAGAEGGAAPDAWYALVHTPGPAMADGGSVFAHPLFAEHAAFLRRLAARGLLVAAGPLSPSDVAGGRSIGAGIGSGMTVVRVPADGSVDIVELAHKDDLSVVGGLLDVVVQPWDVRFSA